MQAVEPVYEINAHSTDRLGFGLLIAAAVHACVIFGVVIKESERASAMADLEVTLVTHRADQMPLDADFWAQQNQEASGTVEDALMPTTTVVDNLDGETEADGQQKQQAREAAEQTGSQLLTTTTFREQSEYIDTDALQETTAQASEETSRRQAILARLDALQQDYAQRPRIGTLTSVSAKARDDAEYQLHLQERIVAKGNINYPQQSLEQGIFGSLRLKLTILQDGSVEAIDILESSGETLLDQAAIKIALESSPFQPFPLATAQRYDKIVFIRTWQFLPGGRLRTGE